MTATSEKVNEMGDFYSTAVPLELREFADALDASPYAQELVGFSARARRVADRREREASGQV